MTLQLLFFIAANILYLSSVHSEVSLKDIALIHFNSVFPSI